MTGQNFFFNFASADRIVEARFWATGWVGRHNGKRLLYALSWLDETSQTSIGVKNETAVDSLCGYVYILNIDMGMSVLVIFHSLREASARCPFYI